MLERRIADPITEKDVAIKKSLTRNFAFWDISGALVSAHQRGLIRELTLGWGEVGPAVT